MAYAESNFAHIDEFNGICEISYDNVNKLLDRQYLSAVQVVNVDVWEKYQADHNIDAACAKLSEKYGREISKDKAKEWYNTYLQALKSDLPLLSFSDNPCDEGQSKHGLWGIGRSYTFPRVMVIMDDAQARGFLFSYEKLFGAKAQSDTDVKNKREGKDTSITRTARLFYVACTRAQKSLAVVAYTANVESVKNTALSNGWFSEDEIYIL